MAVTTLLDIAKANGSDAAVGLIEEVMTYSPEVNLGAARTIKGLSYKTLVRTAGSNVAMPGYLGVRPNPIVGTNEQMAEVIAGFRELGFKHWVAELDPCTSTSLEEFAKVIEILDRSSK